METLYDTNFNDIKLLKKGKVRDIYDLDDYILFVATDRISAFDVIMSQPVPNKGKILTQISKYWFENTKHIIQNNLISTDIADYPTICHKYKSELTARSKKKKKTKPIMLECVVRGYIAGSGWKEYKATNKICGIDLPVGLKEYSKLPSPIFTPSTKAEEGHDENIDFQKATEIIGVENAINLKNYSLQLFNFASEHLLNKGIILADTKFEFGIDNDNNIILIDEVLTPDSSRFWLQSDFKNGKIPYNFDKQILRDYLETIDWNKQPPPPILPVDIINKTIDRYNFALDKIVNIN
jgi:phosphoribosylaminoimidazole-succinocarboxamide synthase